MTWYLTRISLMQLVRQRRTLLLVLLAALPVGLAILFRVTGNTAAEDPNFAPGLLVHFAIGLVLPLTALVVGTAALGQEIEDGTVVYLIAKPLARWKVVAAKLLAAWLLTTAVVAASIAAAGMIVLAGTDEARMVPACIAAACLGALAYVALFMGLSVRFGRALIFGLLYVFVWEALVAQFIIGVRFLSVRAYTTSVAEALADSPSPILNGSLGVTTALLLLSAWTAGAVAFGVRRMRSFQMSERV